MENRIINDTCIFIFFGQALSVFKQGGVKYTLGTESVLSWRILASQMQSNKRIPYCLLLSDSKHRGSFHRVGTLTDIEMECE